MTKSRSWKFSAIATVLVASLTLGFADMAHAQTGMHKGGGGGPGIGQGSGKGVGPGVMAPKGPVTAPAPITKGPPAVVKPKVATPRTKHAHRPWRPGLKWRWIVVPTIIIAENLDWCHYHRYRVSGMRFHRHVECHRHVRWNHPSLRYVEAW